jgi:23S rRNA (cytosine1962-C5)-methyltransferase
MSTPLPTLLSRACEARASLIDSAHESAFRAFNGFAEGEPALAIDLYATTAVVHDYADAPGLGTAHVQESVETLRAQWPWLRCVVVKTRSGATPEARRGEIVWGGPPDTRIREHGVVYAIDLAMNRDASLYLDTRELRRWALEHLRGKTVLNTFAYTGSLGVAALAGGASHVVQLDLNRRFLELARRSCELNGIDPRTHEILDGDFFPRVAQLKREGRLFDCIFLDPPFFATSTRGTVDLENSTARLINKVRPLIAHDGWLVAVNNALYASGAQFMAELESLCADGYLAIETLVPVPEDFTGCAATRIGTAVTDPAPFNHSTKIAILRVTRKGGIVEPRTTG